MERAAVDGITLEYEVAGAGESVLCVHGAFVVDATHFLPLGGRDTEGGAS